MYIEKREEIKELLNQFELSIESSDANLFIKDLKYPSLVLWSKYQQYLNNVLSLFEPKEKSDYENLEKVISFLNLDYFNINIKECEDKSKLYIRNYIQQIKERIKV